MTDEIKQIDMPLSLGQVLKNARETSKLTQDDVAEHLRLKKNVVEKIESDGYKTEELSVFVRGYIRSYAKFVSVAADEIESYFIALGIVEKPQVVERATFTLSEEPLTKHRPMKALTMGIVGVLILLALVWMFWQHGESDNFNTLINNSSVATADNSKTTSGDVVVSEGAESAPVSTTSLADQYDQNALAPSSAASSVAPADSTKVAPAPSNKAA